MNFFLWPKNIKQIKRKINKLSATTIIFLVYLKTKQSISSKSMKEVEIGHARIRISKNVFVTKFDSAIALIKATFTSN